MSKKQIKISNEEIQSPFITPPALSGQMVERSYACTEDYIIEHKHDRSSGEITLTAYEYETYDSQNPQLGREVGSVSIVD